MSDKTGIQWTHVPGYIGATWNPTTGCTRVSPGCDHCYAFTLHDQRHIVNRDAARAADVGGTPTETAAQVARLIGISLPMPPQYDVPFSTVQLLDEKRLTAPLRTRKPHAYFVDSMSDLFHEDVPDEFIDRVFAVMALSPQHVFQLLTKRPERMRAYLLSYFDVPRAVLRLRESMISVIVGQSRSLAQQFGDALDNFRWPLPNVWLGVSAENQEQLDRRIPEVLATPAAVRFVSAEPLLGPVDISDYMPGADYASQHHGRGLDWVIIGGESGKGARPFDLAWARSLRDQCQAEGVAYFLKQLGARPYERHSDGDWCGVPRIDGGDTPCDGRHLLTRRNPDGFDRPLHNSHGSDPAEWPEDLRDCRAFPDAEEVRP